MIDSQCKEIIQSLKITQVVETGTNMGETVAEVSRWFAEWDPGFGKIVSNQVTGAKSFNSWNQPIQFPVFVDSKSSKYKVTSVDIDPYAVETASRLFASNPNISIVKDSSEAYLNQLTGSAATSSSLDTALFYLDAHWGKYWPLRDEIKALLKLKKLAIVVDDFAVPGKSNLSRPHADFGFDIYDGKIQSWGYIHDLFLGKDVRVFYPNQSNRDRRGWVLILLGYGEQELSALKKLPLFEVHKDDPSHIQKMVPNFMTYFDWKNIVKSTFPASSIWRAQRMYEKVKTLLQ